MNIRTAHIPLSLAATALPTSAAETPPVRPKSGKVEIMPLAEVKQGMKGTAWTVFQGTEPEPIPVEIVGIARNMWGPKQDIILGKMGGKAARTNVAKGICGITPIELMLEINGGDQSHPAAARAPGKAVALSGETEGVLESLVPIDSPLG